MPRKTRNRVEDDISPQMDVWLTASVSTITRSDNMFVVDLLLANPEYDYGTIRAELPAPVRPSNRIGQLLTAAGMNVAPGERIEIDQAVGKEVRIRLMQTDRGVEPIAFAPRGKATPDPLTNPET